jgi:hypothetical protein
MILLQILDEGSITDSQGRKIDFRVPNILITPALRKLMIYCLAEYYRMSNI